MKYERFRAACAAMQAIITSDHLIEPKGCAMRAVKYADALVKELYATRKTVEKAGNEERTVNEFRGPGPCEGLFRTTPSDEPPSKA